MANRQTVVDEFLRRFPERDQPPTWQECGSRQEIYRRKRVVKIPRDTGSVVALSKAFSKWQALAPLIMQRVSLGFLARRIDALEAEVQTLKRSAISPRSVIVPIETFAPYPFEVVKPFHVVVEPVDDEFEANLYDANIGASGDTESEAIANLKDIMVNLFERYSKEGEQNLGPGPAKQWVILKGLLNKRA